MVLDHAGSGRHLVHHLLRTKKHHRIASFNRNITNITYITNKPQAYPHAMQFSRDSQFSGILYSSKPGQARAKIKYSTHSTLTEKQKILGSRASRFAPSKCLQWTIFIAPVQHPKQYPDWIHAMA